MCESDPTPGDYTSDNTLLALRDIGSVSSCSVEYGQYVLHLGQSSGADKAVSEVVEWSFMRSKFLHRTFNSKKKPEFWGDGQTNEAKDR
jgi:hypothetical protein